jgi:uncharacterized protein YndB with AHSA1/START domain
LSRVIYKNIRVRCSVPHAFRVFTQKIDLWWPSSHRMGAQPSKIEIEGREGGRFYSLSADGGLRPMGHVLCWEPPERLTCAWYLGTSAELPTEVDVRFVPEGDHTLVEVVHREVHPMEGAWPVKARIYAEGWQSALEALRDHVDALQTEAP